MATVSDRFPLDERRQSCWQLQRYLHDHGVGVLHGHPRRPAFDSRDYVKLMVTGQAPLSFSGTVPETRGEETRYFDYCQQGKLMIQWCEPCEEYLFYPRAVCPLCLEAAPTWVEASGGGTVFTFTVHHRFPQGMEEQGPYVVAVVELDEGVRLMSRVISNPDDVTIGLRVEARFARITATFQVPVFVPAPREV